MGNTYASKEKAIAALTKIEESEIGYLEKKTASKLDSKSANAGYNNYTKYWRDINDWGFFNYGKGWAGGSAWYWCAGFQFWCFVKAFGKTNAKKLLLHAPYTSCQNLGTLGKAKGQLSSTPKVGDIVLFYNGSRFSHTGYVYNTTGANIFTIEGNTNASDGVVPNGGAVCKKKYSRASCRTKGHKFFRPDYSAVVDKKSATTKKATATKKATTTTKKKTTASKTVKVKTSGSNLKCRKIAAANGAEVGKFKNGTTLKLIEKTNDSFWKVSGTGVSGKEITGFSATKYLK